MKKIMCLLILSSSCCKKGPQGNVGLQGPIGNTGTSCSIETVEPGLLAPAGGALITCGLTSSLLVNGTNGLDGAVGQSGSAGSAGLNGLSAYDLWLGEGNEGTLSDYLNSLVGETGATGQTGSQGSAGSVGATGPMGRQGPAGLPSAYSVVDVLNPCGVNGSQDEIFLRLQNGLVVVSFSDNANGLNTRLSLLKTGSYSTTDGYSCSFSAVINNNGTGSLSWSGGGVTW